MGGASGFWVPVPEGKKTSAKIPDEDTSLIPLVPLSYMVLKVSGLYTVPRKTCLKHLPLGG